MTLAITPAFRRSTDCWDMRGDKIVPAKPSRKPRTPEAFGKAFDFFVKNKAAYNAMPLAGSPKNTPQREAARRLLHPVIPATVYASSDAKRAILAEARRFYSQNRGKPTISACVDHVIKQGCAKRVYRKSGQSSELGISQVRKIITQGLGIKGKRGRPNGR